MLPIRTILCGTDFSSYSDHGLLMACALAEDCRARLLIIHVRELVAPPVGEFGVLPPELEDAEEVRAKLQAFKCPGTEKEGAYFLLDGVPAAELLTLAKEQACDLIVVGSHGRRGLTRLLMGSVAEQVVRGAECPVLVVKHPVAKDATAAEARAEHAAV